MAVPSKMQQYHLYTPKELKAVSPKGICTPMFISALFTVTEVEQARCSRMAEWINETWRAYHGTLFYKGKHLDMWNNTHEPRGDHSKISQCRQDKYYMVPLNKRCLKLSNP